MFKSHVLENFVTVCRLKSCWKQLFRPSDEYGELDDEVKASTSKLPSCEPDDMELSRQIPFGPVPTACNYVAASPDSDAFTCFSTSPASQVPAFTTLSNLLKNEILRRRLH